MKRHPIIAVLQALRVALVVMFASIFAFQNAPSSAGFEADFSIVQGMPSADCAAEKVNQPAGHNSHSTHCCIVCNHHETDRLLFDFIFTCYSISIGLTPSASAPPAQSQNREPHPPYNGWATSWSSQAPPAFS